LAIHSIPTDVLPEDDEQLFTFIKNSIHNAKAVTIGSASYLNKDRATRLSKQATSVVVSVNPDDVPVLLPALVLFSKRLKVEETTQANLYTQCLNCYRFGHAHPRCSQKHPTCPYCALHHTRSAHRCQNPTCPRGGDTKAVSGCCPTSPPTARTAATITMPSPGNARLDQSPHLNPRPPHLPTRNYPTPPPIVRKPWMWATMAVQHPLLPMPLQPAPSTSPPRGPPSKPETPSPPPAGPSQHPLAGACRQ